MKNINELRKLIREQVGKILNENDIEDYYAQERRESEKRHLEMRQKTPMSSIRTFFRNYGVDINGLNQELVKSIYVNWDDYVTHDDISDMEESEQENGPLSVELDGIYGKHWVSFNNHAEWKDYFQKNIANVAKSDFEKAYKELDMNQKASQGEFEKNDANALGSNLDPEVLKKLKGWK